MFWAEHKDRFLRQLMIRDMEERWGRRIIVYHSYCASTSPAAQINGNDDQYVYEALTDVGADEPLDLILETNGGTTDGAEKLATLFRSRGRDLRVIVPRRAKSNGTLIALAAKEIVMGPASELGPIQPMMPIVNAPPCEARHIVEAAKTSPQAVDPITYHEADDAIKRSSDLAEQLLRTGMLRDSKLKVSEVVQRLANRRAHGAVIDANEAINLGLRVDKREDRDEFWNWIWLLRCAYESDALARGWIKIFEGRRVSNALMPPPANPQGEATR